MDWAEVFSIREDLDFDVVLVYQTLRVSVNLKAKNSMMVISVRVQLTQVFLPNAFVRKLKLPACSCTWHDRWLELE